MCCQGGRGLGKLGNHCTKIMRQDLKLAFQDLDTDESETKRRILCYDYTYRPTQFIYAFFF
jgi:hypothetical protein